MAADKDIIEESGSETASISKPVKWKPSDYERVKASLPPNTGFSTFVKEAALEKLDRVVNAPRFRPIRLLGLIQAGEATDVKPLPEDGLVHPPFDVPADSYALLVVGDSMEAEYGKTIPDGSYAVFRSNDFPGLNALVHVEWDDHGRQVATFKRYVPLANGEAEFHPLNTSKHKPILRKKGDYSIRGVFLKAWDGKGDQ